MKLPPRGALVLLFSTVVLLAGGAFAQVSEKLPMIAVFPLTGSSLDEGALEGITASLGSKLLNSGKFRVMERTQMAQILKEQNFQQSGACDSATCAIEAGKVLGIDQMVVGSVGRVGSTWSLNARLVSVATGETVRTSTRNQQGTIDQVLTELVPDAALELSGDPAPDRPAVAQRKRVIWPWITGGAVVAGGAVAAAILLSSDKSSSSPSASQDAPHFKISW